ncbi:hypothetical protein J2Z66_004551 [Paenibacillus eucommiae]|uniref:Uncharacterized protein n=1 Tax=Paenibacillus eucommiae TaxID=1355755 RepID=A0ABS4IZB6_9BACL|nr:hypothetical protein [Paenibacillus eucommiae]
MYSSAKLVNRFCEMNIITLVIPMVTRAMSKGLSVIGMITDMKQRYILGDKRLSLKKLYATLPKSKKEDVLGFVIVRTACGMPIKLVFVQNRLSFFIDSHSSI